MTVYICLLRGINVGGKRMKMADVRDMFKSIGYPDVQTLLASGNVIFEADATPDTLVPEIEAAIIEKFGFESKIIIRTADQLEKIITDNPFSVDELEPKFLHVNFMRSTPSQETIDTFQQDHSTSEIVHVIGQEAYIYYTDGAGRSKFNLEKSLNVIGTARNWNTVLKLKTLANELLNR